MKPENNPQSLIEINRLNAQFWARQTRLTARRIADPMSFDIAKRDMDSEAIRVTLRERKSLDQALADAEKIVSAVRKTVVATERDRGKSVCRSGGLARKSDRLQLLIEQLVREAPEMTQRELLHQLKRKISLGTIVAIEEHWVQFRVSKNKLKSAPISGLKDRLHRAKRKNRFALATLRE